MGLLYEGREAYRRGLSRRRFLKLSALTALASTSPCLSLAATNHSRSPEKSLSLYNTHTGESLVATYWAEGAYVTGALTDIDHILRDHRTGEIRPIDTPLLDFLQTIGLRLDTREPFHIISGYRSPKTNALLRKQGRGVAKNSLHIYGKAVDIRLPGCCLSVLRRAAMSLKCGGVGYYPRPNFIHIDVGRVRCW